MLASRKTTNYAEMIRQRYCTWSIAHGIRHLSSSFPENRCGNDEGNDGAACLRGKPTLPMLTYRLVPNIPLDCYSRVRVLENDNTSR